MGHFSGIGSLRKQGEEVEGLQAGQEEPRGPWGVWDPRVVGLGGPWSAKSVRRGRAGAGP